MVTSQPAQRETKLILIREQVPYMSSLVILYLSVREESSLIRYLPPKGLLRMNLILLKEFWEESWHGPRSNQSLQRP